MCCVCCGIPLILLVIWLLAGAVTGLSIAIFGRWGLIIGLPTFFLFTLVSLFCICATRKRHRQDTEDRIEDAKDGDDRIVISYPPDTLTITNLPETVTPFSFELLNTATDGFSTLIGNGGFGSVFKGCLPDSTPIAVKCLPIDGDDESFMAEVAAMAGLNHTNLVHLIGVSAQRLHRILVYEFMENSSMDRWIFSTPDRRRHLDWKTRLSIALDAARGLAYLHDESRSCVLHLDIKPENILLDDVFRAKIADFGLAKALRRDLESRWVTSKMRGTPGYMAPEWLFNQGVTAKSDVFSFGVVLLEIVCGRRCVDSAGSERSWYLPSVVFSQARQGKLETMADPAVELAGTEDMEVIFLLVKIALWCVQGNPAMRPTMSAVVSMIQGDLPVNEPPLHSNIPFAPSVSDASIQAMSNITSSWS